MKLPKKEIKRILNQKKQIVIRLEQKVINCLKAKAKNKHRSLNNYLEHIILDHFADIGGGNEDFDDVSNF